jgi:hypothetical protein
LPFGTLIVGCLSNSPLTVTSPADLAALDDPHAATAEKARAVTATDATMPALRADVRTRTANLKFVGGFPDPNRSS